MTVAIDTNVISGLWSGLPALSTPARVSLQRAGQRDALVIAPVVYAELAAAPGRDLAAVDAFLRDAGIDVDWDLDREVWRLAALAYRGYAERRRRERGGAESRRILADFVIGAHAEQMADALLTFDRRIYRAAFPSLTIITPER
jgi:predicted nucleic acid-binding protein